MKQEEPLFVFTISITPAPSSTIIIIIINIIFAFSSQTPRRKQEEEEMKQTKHQRERRRKLCAFSSMLFTPASRPLQERTRLQWSSELQHLHDVQRMARLGIPLGCLRLALQTLLWQLWPDTPGLLACGARSCCSSCLRRLPRAQTSSRLTACAWRPVLLLP